MKLTPSRLALAVSLALPCLAHAGSFSIYEARGFAMGGAGVASSEYAAASLYNPALLAVKTDSDAVSFIFPALGARVSGNKGAVDAVMNLDDNQSIDRLSQAADRFRAAYTACQAGGCNNDANLRSASGQVASAAQTVLNDLTALDGKTYQVGAGTVLAVALPKWEYKGALSVNVEFHGRATPTVASSDLADARTVINGANAYATSGAAAGLNTFINTATGEINVGANNNDYQSNFRVVGAAIADLGVSLATTLTVADQSLLVGITPKIQQVNTVAYTANVDNNDFDLNKNKKTATGVNLDIGVAKTFEDQEGLLQNLRVGAVVRNLIPKTYRTSDPNQSVKIAPQLRVGAAWTGAYGTVTSDIDLTANKVVGGDDSQIVALGGEMNAFNVAKLRLGYRQDIKQKYGAVTAGFSLLGLQISAAYSKDREMAAMLQFGASF